MPVTEPRKPPAFARNSFAWAKTREKVELQSGLPYDEWGQSEFKAAQVIYRNVAKKYGELTPDMDPTRPVPHFASRAQILELAGEGWQQTRDWLWSATPEKYVRLWLQDHFHPSLRFGTALDGQPGDAWILDPLFKWRAELESDRDKRMVTIAGKTVLWLLEGAPDLAAFAQERTEQAAADLRVRADRVRQFGAPDPDSKPPNGGEPSRFDVTATAAAYEAAANALENDLL